MPILSGKMQRLVSKLQWSTSFQDYFHEEVDEDGGSCPRDVPKGCLAVYVGTGDERRRFVVRTHLLSNHLFKALLDRAAEEYGYSFSGALTIPCDAVLFEHFMWLLQKNDPAAAALEVDELLNFYNSMQ